MTDEYIVELKEAGVEVNVYEVNEEEDMKEMLRVGVDGIIGNFPDLAAKVIAQAS
jgi:glycerophosphoryl diester phosphodiesterase